MLLELFIYLFFLLPNNLMIRQPNLIQKTISTYKSSLYGVGKVTSNLMHIGPRCPQTEPSIFTHDLIFCFIRSFGSIHMLGGPSSRNIHKWLILQYQDKYVQVLVFGQLDSWAFFSFFTRRRTLIHVSASISTAWSPLYWNLSH